LYNQNRSGGFIDRNYPNMIVATFGIRDADSSTDRTTLGPSVLQRDGDTIVDCNRCAMKLALLAQKYREQMTRYQLNNSNSNINSNSNSNSNGNTMDSGSKQNSIHHSLLLTHIGVHACTIPVSSLLPQNTRYQTNLEKKEQNDGTDGRDVKHQNLGEERKEQNNGNQSDVAPPSPQNNTALNHLTNQATTTTLNERLPKETATENAMLVGKSQAASEATQRMSHLSGTSEHGESEDNSLIYKIDDNHVDFAVELGWLAKQFGLEVVISPQAMVTLSRSERVQMKDIIVRDLDILRSNAYPTRPLLKVFELIAFEHVGSHDPGLLKAIRHYETGLVKYRHRQFKDASIHFQSAIAISDDRPSEVLYARSIDFQKHPPPSSWHGEWELSKSQYDFD